MICKKYAEITKWSTIFKIKFDCYSIRIKHKYAKKEIILERYKDNCYGCISHRTNSFGYVHIDFKGKSYKMHRFIYCLLTNNDFCDIDEHVLLHSCDNPLCANPLHLKPGTQAENLKDMRDKHRARYRKRMTKEKEKVK